MSYEENERLLRSRQTQRLILMAVALVVTISMMAVTLLMFEQVRSREEAQRALTNDLLTNIATEYGRALYSVDRLVECRCGEADCQAEREQADAEVEIVLSNQLVRTLEITSVTGRSGFASDYQSVVMQLSDLRNGLQQTGGRSSCQLERDMAAELRSSVTELLEFFVN